MTESEHSERTSLDLDLPVMDGSEVGETFATTDLGYCLVTGGAGFLGRHLTFELIRRGEIVRVFDCVDLEASHERLDFVKGDIRRLEDVRKACEGIDTVFHTAAVLDFFSFVTHEQRDQSYAVNVKGVENVVDACVGAGVKRLVHTSSNNVTFGDPVLNGDETDPTHPTRKISTPRPRSLERRLRSKAMGAEVCSPARSGPAVSTVRATSSCFRGWSRNAPVESSS